jgi:hypothetical protein
MTRSRALRIEMHSAIELVLGATLILLPYAIGLSAPAAIVGFITGAILAGLALTGADSSGRGGLPLSAHAVYDWAIGTGLICAGIVLGFASGPAALFVFLAAGAAELTLTAATSYTPSRF